MKDNDLNKENVIKITDSEFENGEMDIDMMLDSVFLGLEYVNKTRPMSVPRLFTEAIPSDIAQNSTRWCSNVTTTTILQVLFWK